VRGKVRKKADSCNGISAFRQSCATDAWGTADQSVAAPCMKTETSKTLWAFAIELAIYALLVTGYFFLVLHFLGSWLYDMQGRHRYAYAGLSILLIIGQAVVLEGVTTFLLRLLRGRSE
jgi:hypothetical protein